MKTEETVEEQIKKERIDAGKKVMSWTATLPWAILTMVLVFLSFKGINPNTRSSDAKARDGSGLVSQVSPIVNTNVVTKTVTNVVTNVVTKVISEEINFDAYIKEFQKTAIKNGYAKWDVNDNGLVSFKWIEGLNTITNVIRVTTNVVVNVKEEEWHKSMIMLGAHISALEDISLEFRANRAQNRSFGSIPPIDPQPGTGSEPRFGKTEMDLAKSIKFDVELEIIKNVSRKIEYAIHTWDGVSKADLLNKLKMVVSEETKIVFDGFEAYNK